MILRNNIFIYGLLFLTPIIRAQSVSDSIQNLIDKEKNQQKIVDLMYQQAQSFRRKSTDSVIDYANKTLNKATEINYELGIANANIALAWAHLTRSENKKAKLFCSKAIEHYKKTKNYKVKLGACYRLLAAIYTDEKKSEQALKYLLKAKDIYNIPSLKNKEVRSLVLNDIAYLYLEIDNYEMSMKYLNESVPTAKENDQTATLADCYNILGIIANRQEDYVKAIEYYLLSKDIYTKNDDLLGIAICNTNIGIANYKSKNYLKAIEILEETTEQLKNKQFNIGLMNTFLYLGKSHTKLNKLKIANSFINKAKQIANEFNIKTSDIALGEAELKDKKGKYKEAILKLEHLLKEENNTLPPKEKIELLKILSTLYDKNNNLREALNTKDRLIHTKDSINDLQKIIQVKIMQVEFDYKKMQNDLKNKEKELSVSKEKTRTSNLLNGLLLASGILLIGSTMIIYYRRKSLRKSRKEMWKTKRELQELKQKQLDDEINFKNQQITDFALHISEKNDLLLGIKEKLRSLTSSTKKESVKVNELILFLNNNLEQNKEKIAFYSVVDNTKDAFYHKLSELYPELSEKEKRVAIFVRLNMASKQIGIHLNITKASVDNYRYSLRKKMGVPKDVFLQDFIKNI